MSKTNFDATDLSQIHHLFAHIDGPLLRRQRFELITLLMSNSFNGHVQEALEGLNNLLDEFAYVAHDVFGVDCLMEDSDQ